MQNHTSDNILLFVYGTLKSTNDRRHPLLPNSDCELLGSATTHAEMFLISYYPGIILASKNLHTIHGELYRMKSKHLALIDEYEELSTSPNSEYTRNLITVTFNQELIKSYAYIYNKPTSTFSKIESGNFQNHIF